MPLKFVVLVSSGAAAPAALLSALAKKGGSVSVRGHAVALMLELAAGPAHAVVLPRDLPAPVADELDDALAAHYPATALWTFGLDEQGRPALTARRQPNASPPARVNGNGQSPARPAASVPEITPLRERARQSDVPRQASPRVVRVPPEADKGQPLISEEELVMLLGPLGHESEYDEPEPSPHHRSDHTPDRASR